MRDSTLRVVVASERPEFRHMLAGAVEREPGAVVVGQADNSLRALELARRLRPEVALVDPDLPYVAGMDKVRLSRMSGFDTALNISKEVPRVATMLVSMPGATYAPAADREPELWAYGDSGAGAVPLRLRDLVVASAPSVETVFGGVRLREIAQARSRLAAVMDKMVLCGGLGILGGLALTATIILAGAGVALAGVGAATLVLGFIGKLALSARSWRSGK